MDAIRPILWWKLEQAGRKVIRCDTVAKTKSDTPCRNLDSGIFNVKRFEEVSPFTFVHKVSSCNKKKKKKKKKQTNKNRHICGCWDFVNSAGNFLETEMENRNFLSWPIFLPQTIWKKTTFQVGFTKVWTACCVSRWHGKQSGLSKTGGLDDDNITRNGNPPVNHSFYVERRSTCCTSPCHEQIVELDLHFHLSAGCHKFYSANFQSGVCNSLLSKICCCYHAEVSQSIYSRIRWWCEFSSFEF